MRRLPYVLFLLIILTACDDGDIIDFELEFDDQLDLCDDSESNYLLFNIKDDPFESLTLLFPKTADNEIIFNPASNDTVITRPINNSSTLFNYRTYNGDPGGLICTQIIDPDVRITNDYPAASGATAEFTTSFIDDDNDGIDAEIENPDNLPYDEAPDYDGDGLPDYLDADDDNDNVLTRNELGDYEETGVFLDTDEDNIPDYLDDDDDGDGILTREEDRNLNGNPRDDFDENSDNLNIPRYLDPLAILNFDYNNFTPTEYQRSISVSVRILDAAIGVLRASFIDMGTYTTTDVIRTEED